MLAPVANGNAASYIKKIQTVYDKGRSNNSRYW